MTSYQIALQVTLKGNKIVDQILGKEGTVEEALAHRQCRVIDVSQDKNLVLLQKPLTPVLRSSNNRELRWSFIENCAWSKELPLELVFEISDAGRDDYQYSTEKSKALICDPVNIVEQTLVLKDGNNKKAGEIRAIVSPVDNLETMIGRLGTQVTGAAAGLTETMREVLPALTSTERTLGREKASKTNSMALWVAIRQRTNSLAFNQYRRFINRVFCIEGDDSAIPGRSESIDRLREHALEPGQNFSNVYMNRVDAYNLLKVATDAFLLIYGCGPLDIDRLRYIDEFDEETVRLNSRQSFPEIRFRLERYLTVDGRLPYLQRILETLPQLDIFDDSASEEELNAPDCEGLVLTKEDLCMIELIWSYWHEEGMLAQAMNAISMRFQNRRVAGHEGLANFELDPLRPLNNFLWGFVNDEKNRLSVARRVYEYDHHYGLKLIGKAVPDVQSVDSRSKFLETFHNLLYLASVFYQEDDETTVLADAYRLLKALIDLHLILAQGAHNQFGDLPWTARSEMMSMQWLLQRAEMREFLRGRYMVPHQEAWMGPITAIRTLNQWGDTPIKHFRDLAVYAEQLLLSVRFGNWIDVINQEEAKNWARYWRPEIQGYIYAYQTVTGVDLSADQVTVRPEIRYAQPARLLHQRMKDRDMLPEAAVRKKDRAQKLLPKPAAGSNSRP